VLVSQPKTPPAIKRTWELLVQFAGQTEEAE
jgi:hypothetical protein